MDRRQSHLELAPKLSKQIMLWLRPFIMQTHSQSGADLGFEKGGFNVVPKSDTGGATNNYLWKHQQESTAEN